MLICLVLSLAAFTLQWQGFTVERDSIWPAQPKISLSVALEKKFPDPSLKGFWKHGFTSEFEKAQMKSRHKERP